MNKNYLLWLIFFVLISVTSATACIAAGQDSVNSQSNIQESSMIVNEEATVVSEKTNQNPSKDKSKEQEVKQEAPSILSSNFIFYIIYKFKFVEAKSNHSNESDENGDVEIPILSYTRSLYTAIHTLLEKRF